MTVKEIREMAKQLSVKRYSNYRKADLIREIQQAEANEPCFQRISDCWEFGCLWRQECQHH